MASDNYNHPSYITRQMEICGKTTAGASGTTLLGGFPTAMRVRRMSALVTVAGTSAVTGAFLQPYAYDGTSTYTATGSIATGSSAVNAVVTSADLNFLVPANAALYVKNGTDASAVAIVTAEIHLDPTNGSW